MLAPFPRFLTGLKAAHRRLYRRREQSASYRPGLGQQVHKTMSLFTLPFSDVTHVTC